jgi:sarcosine oxidase gamma subunit
MRADYDAALKWTPAPAWADARLVRDGWAARAMPGLHLALVSGEPHRLRTALPVPQAGLWALEPAETVALRAAPDRFLVVSTKPLPIAPGWRDGLAVSDAGSAFAVFDLSGPAVRDVVAEAVSADLDASSPSAATLFAGVWCLLHRVAPDTARIVVEAPLAAYAWRWLELRV